MPTAVPLLVEALKNWMGGLLSCCFWLPEPGDFEGCDQWPDGRAAGETWQYV